jgi:hypothetical protein
MDPTPEISSGHCLPKTVRRRMATTSCTPPVTSAHNAEHGEDVPLIAGCGDAQGDRRRDADSSVQLQQLPLRPLLFAGVDYRGDHIDQRIEHEQDSDARRQGVGRRQENHPPDDGDETTNEEEA